MATPRAPGRQVVLVPRLEREPAPPAGAPRIRRFSLARVTVSPRSELGYDRHERLERAAEPPGERS